MAFLRGSAALYGRVREQVDFGFTSEDAGLGAWRGDGGGDCGAAIGGRKVQKPSSVVIVEKR